MELNYLAILAVAVLGVVLGSLWYGPLFGKAWMRLAGISMPAALTKEIKQRMILSYLIQFTSVLFMSFIFGGIVSLAVGYSEVFATALVLWLAFVVPPLLPAVLWEGRKWQYFFITSGYYLVFLLLAAGIFALWR